MESEEANYQIFSDSKTAMRRAIAEQVFNLNLGLTTKLKQLDNTS